MTNVAVLGMSGRVGRCLVRAIRESPDFTLTGALASPTSSALGRDAGEVAQTGPVAVPVTADRAQALARAEVAIDFTLPEALTDNLAAVERAGIPLVVGITGLDAARQAAPHASLVYNDYMGWTEGSARHREGVLKLLSRLKSQSVKVDMVGVQSHIGPGLIGDVMGNLSFDANEQASLNLASELLGHTDPKVTIEHYIRRNEQVNPLTAELLDQAFARTDDE